MGPCNRPLSVMVVFIGKWIYPAVGNCNRIVPARFWG